MTDFSTFTELQWLEEAARCNGLNFMYYSGIPQIVRDMVNSGLLTFAEPRGGFAWRFIVSTETSAHMSQMDGAS